MTGYEARLSALAKRFDPKGSGHRVLCSLLGIVISRYGGSAQWFKAPWGARWCVYAVRCADPTEEYSRDQSALNRALSVAMEEMEKAGDLQVFTWANKDVLAPIAEFSADTEAKETLERWRDAKRSRRIWVDALAEEDMKIAVCESAAERLGIQLVDDGPAGPGESC